MKRHIILLSLSVLFIFLFIFIPTSYAISEKTLLILVDELNLEDIDAIAEKSQFGIGFVNIRTLENDVEESLYLSIALGRKVGTIDHFQGLYQRSDGEILISGFEDMIMNTSNEGEDPIHHLLGERLKDKGISYIGGDSSAIVAADGNGHIKSGEVEVEYDLNWLVERANFYLSNSNILIISYDINKDKGRLLTLRDLVDEFSENMIIILPKKVSQDMETLFNNYLVPVLYKTNGNGGVLTSSSTRREGFIVLEDIYGELVSIYDEKDDSTIGNAIELVEKQDNIKYIRDLYNDTNNLVLISYIYHGIVYAIQFYTAIVIFRIRRQGILEKVHFIYSFAIVSIFLSFIMGISNYHINIYLYVFINLLVSYMVVSMMNDRGIDTIGLFSMLTYGFIVIAALFFPEIIYKSYIGVNNLFYGARYYGFNNGMMAVLIATSIVSYLFIKERIGDTLMVNLLYFLLSFINIMLLSARVGANTGGFITASSLLLIIIYNKIFKKTGSIKTLIGLALFGVFIFAINMYFDILNEEKSHAINFLIRVKEYGAKEFFSMALIKFKELIKLTVIPPFSITIISQLYSIRYLFEKVDREFAKDAMTIFIVSVIGFLINDTGNIAFIFMNHFLIALFIDKYLKNSLFI